MLPPDPLETVGQALDEQTAPAAGPPPATTWSPVDLRQIVETGEYETPASYLSRDDGVCLLYSRKIHDVAGEPEAGKGWLSLLTCAERIRAGEHVLYVDFEDAPTTAVERLLALGIGDDDLLARFHYVRPDEPLGQPGSASHEAIRDVFEHRPTLVVIDGLTEAYVTHGLDPNSNADAAKWIALLPRKLIRAGATVLQVDHVTKDRETRGRYSIGAQHKLAGVDVRFTLVAVEPFGRGRSGVSRLYVTKDRPARLRRHADESGAIAELHLDAADDELTVSLTAPAGSDVVAVRPTFLMERVSKVLSDSPGLTSRAVRETVKGRAKFVDLALELLVAEGFVRRERDGRSNRHFNVSDYREDTDRVPVSRPCPDRVRDTPVDDRVPVSPPLGGHGSRTRSDSHDGHTERVPSSDRLDLDEEVGQ